MSVCFVCVFGFQFCAQSLPNTFDRTEWNTALAEAAPAHALTSALVHAGAACAYLWSKTPMCRLVQRTILADDEEALERLMPYIRCLNAFILDQKGLLPRKTRTYRTSRMSKAQADPIQPGDKYRLGMYVATSTRKGAISDLRDWQREEMGGLEVKYTWVFTIPKGCRQAT